MITSALPQRYVVFSLDSLGDLTLRQPLLSGLLDRGNAVCVVTRSFYADILPAMDQRLACIETMADPYLLTHSPQLFEVLGDLLTAMRAWAPTTIVCPLYNRTFVDEWLLRNFPEARRFGFFPADSRQSELEKHCPKLAHDLPLEHGDLFTDCVNVDRDLHECDKLQELFTSVVGLAPKLPNPSLSIPRAMHRCGVEELLNSMKVEAGQYAIVAPVSKGSTPLKVLADAQALLLIDRLYFTHGLKSVLIGNLEEKPDLDRIADAANRSEEVAAVWIGPAGSLVELLSLTEAARLYVGCDTGPMHFAAALGVPVLSIFGGGTFPRFLPRARHTAVLTQQLPCFGCDWKCPFDHSLCIDLVDSKRIAASLDTLLNKPNGVIVDLGCDSTANAATFLRELALPALRSFSQLKVAHAQMRAQHQRSEVDREARGEQVNTLTQLLKESEADRLARWEQIVALTRMVKDFEADNAARWEQIVTLTTLVHDLQSKSPVNSIPQ